MSGGKDTGVPAAIAARRTTVPKEERKRDEDMTVREAGRKGGETTKKEVESGQLPKDFYSQIGHKGGEAGGQKGGEATKREVESGELPKDFYSQIGHKGGQKVKELIEKGKETEGE